MELKIKTYPGELIKRGDPGFKSALAWYKAWDKDGTPTIETKTITIEDTAYQLVMEDELYFAIIAVVQIYRGVIEGFRFISDDNMYNIEISICDYSCGLRADNYRTFNILAAVYDNAEFIENGIRLLYELKALKAKEREKGQAPLLN